MSAKSSAPSAWPTDFSCEKASTYCRQLQHKGKVAASILRSNDTIIGSVVVFSSEKQDDGSYDVTSEFMTVEDYEAKKEKLGVSAEFYQNDPRLGLEEDPARLRALNSLRAAEVSSWGQGSLG